MKIERITELKDQEVALEAHIYDLKVLCESQESDPDFDKETLKLTKKDLRDSESNLKKVVKEIAKLESQVEREAEREAKRAAKQAEKQKREEERLLKAQEREAAKLEKARLREENRMPEQNGIRRPNPNTKCGRAWQIADDLSVKFGQPTPIAELLEVTKTEGLNEGNVKAEYARWRKFHGITGRVSLPKQETVTE